MPAGSLDRPAPAWPDPPASANTSTGPALPANAARRATASRTKRPAAARARDSAKARGSAARPRPARCPVPRPARAPAPPAAPRRARACRRGIPTGPPDACRRGARPATRDPRGRTARRPAHAAAPDPRTDSAAAHVLDHVEIVGVLGVLLVVHARDLGPVGEVHAGEEGVRTI